jgi:DNA-binding transcriptional LysR family regulator
MKVSGHENSRRRNNRGMLNRIDLLRTFLVAHETLNFREAAIRLSVSPQVVTRAIKELEGHLGELLFHRSTRSVQPSDFCERFVLQARQAVQGVDALFAAAMSPANARIEGQVRIAAPGMQGRRFVMPVLERLARQHPGLVFDLRLSDQVVDAVAQRIDVGVRVGRLRDNRFVARTVAAVSLRIVAAPALLARIGPVASVADLDTLPTTQLIDRNTGRPWPWTLSRGREILPARAAFVTDDAQAECDAVRAGLGIGQMAGVLIADDLRSGTLAEVLPETAPKPWPLSVYRVQRQPVPARIRVVYEALVAGLRDVES